jgi:hypothetical protein|tara:strand:+ start:197 stop:700 length:504 start_codon:yes stop_codon:yes gene_type:complete
MGTINLYQKFDYTDAAGNTYSDGSTTTARTISVADQIFDRTYAIADGSGGTATTIWSDSTPHYIADFDFLWIESDVDGEIQLVCSEDGTLAGNNIQNGFCIKLKAGIPFVLAADDSRNMGNMDAGFSESNYGAEIDTWETNWVADTIDRIEYYRSGSASVVRVFAVT